MGNNFSEVRNQWFRERIEELNSQGITQAEVARRLGVMPQYLTPIMTGKRNASEKMIISLCASFNINQNDLVKRLKIYTIPEENASIVSDYCESGTVNLKEGIPLITIETLAGLSDIDWSIQEHDIVEVYVVPEFKRRGVEFLVKMSDQSMTPKYNNGDLLGCKHIKAPSFYQWGKVYVLDTDQGPVVKRLFEFRNHEDYLECRSDNTEYPPFEMPKKAVRSVAIVLGVIRLE